MEMRSKVAALSVSALALAGVAVPSVASAATAPAPAVFCQSAYTAPARIRVAECSDGSVRVYRWDATRRVWGLAIVA